MGLPSAFGRLRDERVWVAWADEGGRKVPKSPHGGNAKVSDPSTWGTYAEAEAARAKGGYSGVGLVLTDGYIGIDLDGAVEDGAIADWAQEIIDSFDSYAELSPSGTGVHVIGWSNVGQTGPIGRNNRKGVEVYNHGRYFTVTGNAVNDAPIMDVTPGLEEFIYAHFPGESPERAVRRRVGDLARDQVKRTANRTMAENCARDGVRYARVPRGTETCGFCIMLASRGFVYTTPEAASHAHDGCDCKVVPGFDGIEVEGYDPDALYDLYSEARSRVEGRVTDSAVSREIESVLADRRAEAVAEGESEGWRDERARRTVDMDRVNGRDYRSNIRRVFGDLSETAHADISRMLRHRSGTPYEDLYAYDLTSGERIGSVVNAVEPKRVEPTAELRGGIAAAVSSGHEVVMVHNHPDSMIPSAADIQSLIATGARRGVIACHDGSIYVYEVIEDAARGYNASEEGYARVLSLWGDDEGRLLRALRDELGVNVEHLR